MARLIWSELALQDLEQIADYIALDDHPAACRLVKAVFEKAAMLETFPEMCPHPHDFPNSRYRHLVVGPLDTFHRVEGETVFIVYVMKSERLLRLSEIEKRDNE